jgi:molybdopterin-guanine dinucleotide biosynthesis protein A
MSTRADAGAIVLAGGESYRMGQPKLSLDFGGVPLLTRIVLQLKQRFDEIVIVAAPESLTAPSFEIAAVRVVHDDTAFGGPLEALRRGLVALEHDVGFACSCDLPLLNAYVADALVGMIEDFDAVIPEVGGKLQPLHAVYRKRCASAIGSLAATGEKRLTANANAVNARRITENELRAIDPELRSFFNVNTPDDYTRALQLAGIPPRKLQMH